MTIQARLALTLSALLALTLTGTFAILAWSERSHLRQRQAREQQDAVEKTARVAAEAVLNRNDIILLSYLQSLRKSPAIAAAGFSGADAKIRAHTDPSLLGRAAPSDNRPGRVSRPVESQGKPLGVVWIDFDDGEADRAVATAFSASLRRFIGVFLASLALGAAGAALLARGLLRPIGELARGARRVGEGDLSVRLADAREDELGDLARDFNRMAERLGELDRLKESFLHSVTHEMRSPLNAITAYVSIIAREANAVLPPVAKKGLGIIERESGRLNGFVTDVLDLAKLEARKLEFGREPVELDQLAREVVELFAPAAEKDGVVLECAIDRDGSFRTSGDREALRRALVNLVSNALKFTPEKGRVTVSVRASEGRVEARVQDTGIGVPKERQGQLFTKFGQVQETRQAVRQVSGTGLGLALVKEIVEAHGGEVGVESELHQGATFFFSLPRLA